MRRRTFLGLTVVAGLRASLARAAETPHQALEQARAEMVRTAREYRASLERLLPLQTEAAQRAAATAERRRALLGEGVVSRREAEESEQAAAVARDLVEQTRSRLAEANTLVAEAEAARDLAALPPPKPGELSTGATLVRFLGPGHWSLAMVPQIQRFFTERFGRPLPVSAFGQTPLHDRLGFDHRNAIDVAVHPDSAEGRALLVWLRQHGVSFLGFRSAVPGEATGAHVHVGEPSPRLASLSR